MLLHYKIQALHRWGNAEPLPVTTMPSGQEAQIPPSYSCLLMWPGSWKIAQKEKTRQIWDLASCIFRVSGDPFLSVYPTTSLPHSTCQHCGFPAVPRIVNHSLHCKAIKIKQLSSLASLGEQTFSLSLQAWSTSRPLCSGFCPVGRSPTARCKVTQRKATALR